MALTADEDEDLRRINQLVPYGVLPPLMRGRLDDLRERDRRQEVREPKRLAEWLPNQRRGDDD